MLAYEAAGIFLPHYSGSQFFDTVRVPLFDIQPGDILFYGYNGDAHEGIYIGHDKMIQAEETGTSDVPHFSRPISAPISVGGF
jgi:cell wall-associated NlpC family hydrolase